MNKIVLLPLCLTALTVIASCGPAPVQPSPTPPVSDDDYCDDAEGRLSVLKCEEAEPTKEGKRFTQFCLETQKAGVWLNPRCLAKIKTCDEIDVCTKSK